MATQKKSLGPYTVKQVIEKKLYSESWGLEFYKGKEMLFYLYIDTPSETIPFYNLDFTIQDFIQDHIAYFSPPFETETPTIDCCLYILANWPQVEKIINYYKLQYAL